MEVRCLSPKEEGKLFAFEKQEIFSFFFLICSISKLERKKFNKLHKNGLGAVLFSNGTTFTKALILGITIFR